jgi:vitamin B12/bleomycin/antimicrobial peptide transport system ATP-binding/permease protein
LAAALTSPSGRHQTSNNSLGRRRLTSSFTMRVSRLRAMTRVRENGESIALLGGEQEERDGIDKALIKVLRQWARLAGQHMRTTLVSQGSNLRRQHDARTGDAGSFGLHHRADRVGWLVDNYPRLADWNACARRIASLMMSLDGLDAPR